MTPLAGVGVLDLTRLLPGAYCDWLLGHQRRPHRVRSFEALADALLVAAAPLRRLRDAEGRPWTAPAPSLGPDKWAADEVAAPSLGQHIHAIPTSLDYLSEEIAHWRESGVAA